MNHAKRKHGKIAVLQLSRIGDIIMSLPVIESLSDQYKGDKIYFFINGMFEDLLPESPFFKIIPVHFNTLFEKLATVDTIEDSLDVLDDHLDDYFNTSFDLVINLSSQKVSAILTSLLIARNRYGLTFSSDESLISPHPGLSLFTKIKTGRRINWVHQVEIFLSAVNHHKPHPMHQTGRYLFGDRLDELAGKRMVNEKYILVSSGASLPQKELGKGFLESILQSILANTDYKIVLSGIEEEANGNKNFSLTNSERIIDYTGKTKNFRQLLNLIHHAECLISNDSGPMHIASLLNRKNIAFSIGSAFFPETTGYNSNVLVFTPQHECYPCPWIGFTCEQDYHCKEKFNANQIAKTIITYLNDNRVNSADTDSKGYRTAITQEGLFFIPKGKAKLSAIEFMGSVYQSFWKEKLFDIDAAVALEYLLEHYEIEQADLDIDLLDIESCLKKFRAFLDQLLQLFSEYKGHGNPMVLNKLNMGIDIIFDMSDQESFLSPLLHYYKVLYHSTIPDNPNNTLREYHMKSIALKEDLDKICDLVKSYGMLRTLSKQKLFYRTANENQHEMLNGSIMWPLRGAY